MQRKIGKGNRYENAQLVDRHDNACKPILQRFVIAKPGSTRRKAGKADEA